MKNRCYRAVLAAAIAVLLTGCGADKNENVTKGMEAVAALEYDSAQVWLTWGKPCMGKLPSPLRQP